MDRKGKKKETRKRDVNQEAKTRRGGGRRSKKGKERDMNQKRRDRRRQETKTKQERKEG